MSDSDKPTTEAKAFRALLEEKIQNLVEEFANGKISREQFHILYERYNGRLAIANQALLSGNPEAIQIAQSGPPTMLVRDMYQGKAIGMVIYHNKSGRILETLGDFDAPETKVAGILKEISQKMAENAYLDHRLEKLDRQKWMLFAPRTFSTVVTIFLNEPAVAQMRDIERLHHDFETANHTSLDSDTVDGSKLAYPFLAFVQRWSRDYKS